MRRHDSTLVSAIALLAALAATPARAQTVTNEDADVPAAATDDRDGEEIIITAQRRSERSRDVPITVTNLTNEQLEDANIQELGDIAKVTPALHYEATGAFAQPSIRGVTTALVTSGGGANVGIYIDGFYSPNPLAADSQLMNVQSIQVLKGPQGTLFGRNTTGGAILVTTAKPSTTTAVIAEAALETNAAMRLAGYATFGIVDNVAVDVEGLYRGGNGFQKDIAFGRKHVGQYSNWMVRTGLKVDLSDSISVLLRYTHQDIDDPTSVLFNAWERNGVPLSSGRAFPGSIMATRPNEVATDGIPFFRMNSNVFQGTVTADLGFGTLTSYTQHRSEKSEQVIDLDASTAPFFTISIPVDDTTFSQEFLLTSKPGTPLQWTAGLFYFNYKDHFRDQSASQGGSPFLKFADSGTTTRSIAGFLDLTYQVSPKLFITAGARYSHDEVRDAFFLNPDLITFTELPTLKKNSVTPRLVVRYKPSEASSVYASVTRGYKAPIYNVGGRATVPVRPETITAFEVGYKYGRGPLTADAAAYYYKYKDLQVATYDPMNSIINNAGQSRIYGVEGQVRYRFGGGFEVNAGAAYTNAKYTEYLNAPGIVDFGGFLGNISIPNAKGNYLQRSPKFTGNLGARYETDLANGRVAISGNLSYASKSYFDPENQFAQKGHENLTLRAEWTDPSDHFTFALFADNVTNARYRISYNTGPLAIASLWSRPRSVGVSARVRM